MHHTITIIRKRIHIIMEIIQAICKAILHKLNHESIHNNASHTAPSVLLFLDIDGTLAEFQNNPEHSFIPQQTLTTLGALDARCTLYFVTGRSIAQAESMLPPLHRDHQWITWTRAEMPP
ncbi:trehalose-phosphatase [Acinetobacter pittii]|uniref:HAD hydrolase family protein n=2 Tax=Acinetobacter TaxID=469 RepID=UPI0025B4FD1B|nr:HAD hydrolase family protein [Acinetobacter pittii]MDN4022417.1 trehalose-phosphatase [Acinetobacter pittii]